MYKQIIFSPRLDKYRLTTLKCFWILTKYVHMFYDKMLKIKTFNTKTIWSVTLDCNISTLLQKFRKKTLPVNFLHQSCKLRMPPLKKLPSINHICFNQAFNEAIHWRINTFACLIINQTFCQVLSEKPNCTRKNS
jgi:hypothetical protein